MKSVNDLLKDDEYRLLLKRLEELERDRVFCHHGMEHLLSVARIAWIWNLEEEIGLEKEDIYLAALLHDLGRLDEYEKEIEHHLASEKRAGYFLKKLQYPERKRELILAAVRGHREKTAADTKGLAELLAQADKASRNCGYCGAYESCRWSEEEKNRRLLR